MFEGKHQSWSLFLMKLQTFIDSTIIHDYKIVVVETASLACLKEQYWHHETRLTSWNNCWNTIQMQPLSMNIVAYHPIRQVSSKVKKQQDFYNNIK